LNGEGDEHTTERLAILRAKVSKPKRRRPQLPPPPPPTKSRRMTIDIKHLVATDPIARTLTFDFTPDPADMKCMFNCDDISIVDEFEYMKDPSMLFDQVVL
jgi:hypothetical protein